MALYFFFQLKALHYFEVVINQFSIATSCERSTIWNKLTQRV